MNWKYMLAFQRLSETYLGIFNKLSTNFKFGTKYRSKFRKRLVAHPARANFEFTFSTFTRYLRKCAFDWMQSVTTATNRNHYLFVSEFYLKSPWVERKELEFNPWPAKMVFILPFPRFQYFVFFNFFKFFLFFFYMDNVIWIYGYIITKKCIYFLKKVNWKLLIKL